MGLASCPVTEPLEIPETREAVRADVFRNQQAPANAAADRLGGRQCRPATGNPRRPLSDIADWRGVGVGSGVVSHAG